MVRLNPNAPIISGTSGPTMLERNEITKKIPKIIHLRGRLRDGIHLSVYCEDETVDAF
jgi:hypothetical protein